MLHDSACPAIRIIDANVNRAREALRVMEEYARFGLNDATLTQAIKETRHALACTVREFEGDPQAPGSISLVRSRDILGDVGCDLTAGREYERSDAVDVARAAGTRLSEALRAVEEYGKTLNASFARHIERIRYQGYEIERRLTRTVEARERFAHVRLYVIVTEALCRTEWYDTAVAALEGGADCLQLREKDLSDRRLLDRSIRLSSLCHDHGRLFIVNDRPDIAALSRADGVHLGQDDIGIAQARRIMPSTSLVGISTHTVDQVDKVVSAAPDYIAVGPMFPTATKPQKHLAGPATLAAAQQRTSLPLVAIGAIDEQNAGDVLRAAPCALCVCRAVIARPDVAGAAARLRALAEQASCRRSMAPGPG